MGHRTHRSPSTAFLNKPYYSTRFHTHLASPYTLGSCLDLQFTTKNNAAQHFSVEITKPFMPFTCAIALLVKPKSSAVAHHLGLPDQFVVKVNDRRFNGRDGFPPWSSSLESSLRATLHKIKAGIPCGNYFASLGGTEKQPDDYLEDWMRDIRLLELMKKFYDKEVTAYHQLRPLQGTDIPKFYGTFHMRTPSNSNSAIQQGVPSFRDGLMPLVFDYVKGMALEYIDGFNMEELKVGVDISQSDVEKASEEVLQVLHRICKHNVLHNDARAANVMIRRQHPHKPVIIDFGLAIAKGPDETLEKWRERVGTLSDVKDMRRTLSQAGLHIGSPFSKIDMETTGNDLSGWSMLNKVIENETPEYRDKFYDQVMGPRSMMREMDGGMYEFEFNRWRLKPGVKTRGDDRYQ